MTWRSRAQYILDVYVYFEWKPKLLDCSKKKYTIRIQVVYMQFQKELQNSNVMEQASNLANKQIQNS